MSWWISVEFESKQLWLKLFGQWVEVKVKGQIATAKVKYHHSQEKSLHVHLYSTFKWQKVWVVSYLPLRKHFPAQSCRLWSCSQWFSWTSWMIFWVLQRLTLLGRDHCCKTEKSDDKQQKGKCITYMSRLWLYTHYILAVLAYEPYGYTPERLQTYPSVETEFTEVVEGVLSPVFDMLLMNRGTHWVSRGNI